MRINNQKLKNKNKCKHSNVDKYDVPCPNCGYEEGICVNCEASVSRECIGDPWILS